MYFSAYGIGHSGGSLRRPRAGPRPAQATRAHPQRTGEREQRDTCGFIYRLPYAAALYSRQSVERLYLLSELSCLERPLHAAVCVTCRDVELEAGASDGEA